MNGLETIIMELITAFTGSLGYALLFHLRAGLIPAASVGGMVSWGVYLLSCHFLDGIFVPSFLASAFAALYAEILARIKKAPATIFYAPAVIPLIPGSSLYYTMQSAVQGNWAAFESYGALTAQYALAIAAGMSFIWALCHIQRKLAHRPSGK